MLGFKQFLIEQQISRVSHQRHLINLANSSKSGDAKILVAHHDDGSHTIHAWHGNPDHIDVAMQKHLKRGYPKKFSVGFVAQSGTNSYRAEQSSWTSLQSGEHKMPEFDVPEHHDEMKKKKTELGSRADFNNAINNMPHDHEKIHINDR
jgi:hypothetical protein|tara:strand:- start:29 stop:475 length:447 start_codon:yes stop_codon:yes gene_type:complete